MLVLLALLLRECETDFAGGGPAVKGLANGEADALVGETGEVIVDVEWVGARFVVGGGMPS